MSKPALTALVKTVADVANTTAKTLEDGKVTLAEMFQFAPVALRIAKEAKQYKQAFDEIEEGLTDEDLDQLRQHIRTTVNFGASIELEAFVELALYAVLTNVKLVYSAIDLRKVS